ncbi:Ras-related protein Rab-34 [Fragariocoptes setiger]|uniref:Ras-related protein Rab-34 n=1 Tax=Fragariocoptes setiger TaxID=1670756 RepID=A0ABQ7S9H9_9ACAR|nr:Ras-related protein Rab-34 [Fragariocoptes setiger]
MHSLAKVRQIDEYCLPLTSDATPYPSIDFDPRVYQYCGRISNKISESNASVENNRIPEKSVANSCVNQTRDFGFDWKSSLRTCKVIVTGDVAVGKTCLINRFGYDIYSNQYKTTIGVDFDVQKFHVLGVPFTLQIWDTAGLERFKSITSSYYRGCHAAIIVFDMSNLTTLANAMHWRNELLESCRTSCHTLSTEKLETPLLYLVGSKKDLLSDVDKDFAYHQAKVVANQIRAELWVVSAQSGDNVNELFTRIATVSFEQWILCEVHRIKFEASTLGILQKQSLMQYQKELWHQKKLIKITRKKKGDNERTKCINIKFVIK